jgi:hypothetical protein
MKSKIYFTLVFILAYTFVFSQDTIKVVQYNVLRYGLYNSYCTTSNNNVSNKTNYLKTIINYTRPDIFAVNELSAYTSPNYHDYLLYNVFILNNLPQFQRGPLMGDYLTSQIFYNSNKFTLKEVDSIYAYPRSIYAYKFYYNSPDLILGDTVYFTYYLAHFQAGDDQADSRQTAANNLMSYIDYNNTTDNYLLSGDLNLYTPTEGAYQRLINYSVASIRFVDLGPNGEWHDNVAYANYHTQSSNYNSNGCSAGGGMDDKFDFIMISNAINNFSDKMKYISNSFEVIGNDGQHFNQSISYNGNNSVPSDVLTALENNSDHLPISAEFIINQQPAKIKNYNNNNIFKIQSAEKNGISFMYFDNLSESFQISIYSVGGIEIYKNKFNTDKNNQIYTVDLNLNSGIYLVNITPEKYSPQTVKILIK